MPAKPAKALLSPDNHSLLMIDHQYLQMLTISVLSSDDHGNPSTSIVATDGAA